MILKSIDEQSWLEFEFKEAEMEMYPSFSLAISVQNEGFSGINPEIWLELDYFKNFLTDLYGLDRERTGNAILESITAGEFQLKIQSACPEGPLELQYKLSRNSYCPKRRNVSICGGFELDFKDLSEAVAGFDELISRLG